VTLAQFLILMENGDLEWPPILIGTYVYSRRITVDVNDPQPKMTIVRASVS